MEIASVLLDLVVGFGIGIAIGVTGIGGGALIQPVLIHVLGVAPVPAVGTGLLYAMFTKVWGTFRHYRLKTIRVTRALYFLAGGIPSVLLASNMVNYLFQRYDQASINASVQTGMAVTLLLSAVVLLVKTAPSSRRQSEVPPQAGYLDGDRTPLPPRKKLTAALAGVTVGALVGGTSIGGGVLIIPVLMLFLDCNASQAVGTSIAISVVLAALGGMVYLVNESIALMTMAFMAVAALPGVHIGSKLSVKLPDKVLSIIVIVMVAVSGLSLLFGIGD